MFPVIHGILAQAREGVSVCKYPLNKTDYSDIPLPVLTAEPLDSSFQKFRVKAGLPHDFQVAFPDGVGIDLESGGLLFPNRGTLGDSVVYAIKVKTSGSRRTIQLGVPTPYLYTPELDRWVEIIPLTIERSSNTDGWSVRIGFPNPVEYVLPEEFTAVIFSGEEVELDIPLYTYIPELGVCEVSGILIGAPSTKGIEFGFGLFGSSQNEDYSVELITDRETLVNLIGDYDISAAAGVTSLQTICGEVIDLNQSSGG